MSIRIATVKRPKTNASQWARLRAAVAETVKTGKAVSVEIADHALLPSARTAVACNPRLRALGIVRTRVQDGTLTAWIEPAEVSR